MDNHSSALRPHGGYRRLRSFQVTEIIYDGTVAFCDRFISKRSRTHDQMVQAARSGRQNIAEGSRASATSSQTELRLVNVARASLDELLLDFEDFLRQRGLALWDKNDAQAREVRALGRDGGAPQSDKAEAGLYTPWLNHTNPAVVANTMICLIHQANYLLDHQVAGLEKQFVHEGGYSERLHAARLEERQRQKAPDSKLDAVESTEKVVCTGCGKPMVLRTARQGPNAGSLFWGCSGYPDCKITCRYSVKMNSGS